MCLILGHFCPFPQVDRQPPLWHFGTPHHLLGVLFRFGALGSGFGISASGTTKQDQQDRCTGNRITALVLGPGTFISLRGEMSASNALVWDGLHSLPEPTAKLGAAPALPEKPIVPRVPALRVMPLLRSPQPRRFVRVPTYAVGVHMESAAPARPASVASEIAQRFRRHGGLPGFAGDPRHQFLRRVLPSSPRSLAIDTAIELDIVLVNRPLGYGNVVVSKARVRRVEPANMPGWFGNRASFEDFAFIATTFRCVIPQTKRQGLRGFRRIPPSTDHRVSATLESCPLADHW